MSDSSSGITVGDMADSITSSFTNLTKLITAGSYLAGIGFSTAAILKFKQHKDNPTQIPVGTPIALLAVSAALTFLPSIKAAASAAGVTTDEVKARSGDRFGDPVEAVGWRKQREMARSAAVWIARHGRPGETYRFDVVGVLLQGERVRVRHVASAFEVRPGP